MIVPQVALNVWRAACDQAIADLFRVRKLLADRRPHDADQVIARMIEQSVVLGLSMQQAGAQHPCPGIRAEPARRLAMLLRAAHETAIEADAEEGGAGLADALEPLLEAAERAAEEWEGPEEQGPTD